MALEIADEGEVLEIGERIAALTGRAVAVLDADGVTLGTLAGA